MSYFKQLEGLLHLHARRAGHTNTALQIAKACGAVFIVADQNQKHLPEILADIGSGRLRLVLTLSDCAEGKALGMHAPVVVDHHALALLLSGLKAEINSTLAMQRARFLEELGNHQQAIATLRRQKTCLEKRVQKLKKDATEVQRGQHVIKWSKRFTKSGTHWSQDQLRRAVEKLK